MEKMLKPYDREHMKMAMLKHEETFKKQIYELHRLYRVQKILMKGVENNGSKRPNQQRLNCSSEIRINQSNDPLNFHKKPPPEINFGQPITHYIRDSNGDEETEIEDESEIQLTLGPTRYNVRKKTETSDSGTSFSSASTGSSHIIKGANQGPYPNHENLAWGLTIVTTESNPGYHDRMKSGYRAHDQSSQGRFNQPSWRLQDLRLNIS